MTTRDYRTIYIARLCSQKSKYRIKIGAVVRKGKSIVGLGWNKTDKTHPEAKQDFNFLHAELDAVVGEDRCGFRGATIYIYREKGISKPCEKCQIYLYDIGIKKIIYTIYDERNESTGFRSMMRSNGGFVDIEP